MKRLPRRYGGASRTRRGDLTSPSRSTPKAQQHRVRGTPPGMASLTAQETGPHGVDIQSEHVADTGERKRPRAVIAAHPCHRLGGPRADAATARPTSPLDAADGIFQYREHEGDWSGRLSRPQ